MATKSSKTTKKSTATEFEGLSNKEKRKLKSKAKKIKGKALAVGLIFFLLFGGISMWWCLHTAKTDCFVINGNDEITLIIGETYKDESVKIKEFGIDMSNLVKIETNLKTDDYINFTSDEVGTYHIIYTANTLKFGVLHKVKRIRLLTFVEASEGGV